MRLTNFLPIICSAALVVSGCAQNSTEVAPMYFSPTSYSNLSCSQIADEARQVSSQASHASGVQDKNAQNDAVATGVALVLFWPAVFFIKGDKTNASQLAQLKGQLQAIEQASKHKGCGIQFRRGVEPQTLTKQEVNNPPVVQPTQGRVVKGDSASYWDTL